MNFLPQAAIDTIPYPQNGEMAAVHAPVSMFNDEGLFDPHRPYVDHVVIPCQACTSGQMHRTSEVADTWFDSGSMPFAQWHYPFENKEKIDASENYPADYISEAIDQTRGWFYTLLAVASILQERGIVTEPPFKNVVVLGHINDAQGRKLSKSLGNYVDPMELIEKVGADAVRWYLVTTNQPWDSKNFDLKFVDEGVRKTFLILLNVLSFWELYGKTTTAEASEGDHVLDRWMRSRTAQLINGVTERLERYDLTGAARDLASAVTDVSTWYVRRSRDRMKGADAGIVAATLHDTLMTIAKLMAPFTPFLAEHLYRRLGGTKASVHLEDWPTAGDVDGRLVTDMEQARAVVEEALSLRAAAGIKVRQPLQQLVVTTAIRPELDTILQEELNVKEVHHATALPTDGEWQRGPNTALDISISDELRNEGHLRDLVREFNALRKEAGLQPSDQIVAHIPAGTLAAQIVERYSEDFLRDVRARAATPSLDGATHQRELKLDGPVTIGLAKV